MKWNTLCLVSDTGCVYRLSPLSQTPRVVLLTCHSLLWIQVDASNMCMCVIHVPNLNRTKLCPSNAHQHCASCIMEHARVPLSFIIVQLFLNIKQVKTVKRHYTQQLTKAEIRPGLNIPQAESIWLREPESCLHHGQFSSVLTEL